MRGLAKHFTGVRGGRNCDEASARQFEAPSDVATTFSHRNPTLPPGFSQTRLPLAETNEGTGPRAKANSSSALPVTLPAENMRLNKIRSLVNACGDPAMKNLLGMLCNEVQDMQERQQDEVDELRSQLQSSNEKLSSARRQLMGTHTNKCTTHMFVLICLGLFRVDACLVCACVCNVPVPLSFSLSKKSYQIRR
jgi:hypothetical protein